MKPVRPRRKKFLRFAAASALVLALIWISGVRLYGFRGQSMAPAINEGDYLVGMTGLWGLRTPQRFDRAIFDVPASSKWAGQKIPWMKRLVGLPGEKLRLSGTALYINDRRVEAPFLRSAQSGGSRAHVEVTLGPDEYFVLGDNLDHTLEDSRMLGPIPSSLMKGYVAFVIRRSHQPRKGE
jgi:signal peptidase I